MSFKSNYLYLLLLSSFLILISCEQLDDEFFEDELLEARASTIGTFQAEDHTFQNGCREMSNNAGFTGDGFMDYGGNGSLVEWNNIQVKSAGTYKLKFRYANGSTGDRKCAVAINGSTKGSVSFSRTGSWTKWEKNSIEVRLKAGTNKIRVTANTGSGGPNLDKMVVLLISADDDDNGDNCDGKCSPSCPCDVDEGDCDSDADCKSGLYCPQVDGHDVCKEVGNCDGRCSPSCPCDVDEGDCDSDADCKSGLYCPQVDGHDVCKEEGGDCHSGSPGSSSYCSSACPCGEGEGDCDKDSHCQSGLVCEQQSGSDFCVNPDDDDDGGDGNDDDGSGSDGSDGITHIGTTEKYDSNGQDLRISRPSGSKAGDLLILALHRSDDDLPLYVDGWTRVAECFKKDNGYDCSTERDCTSWHNSDFCGSFGGHGGHDLAQSVFYKKVGSSEPSSYTFDLNRDSSGHPGWAILTALRGAATSDPVRDWSYKGCDGSADSEFPSVYGKSGDMVLLSQSFDDAVSQSKFGAPSGTSTFGYVSQSDESGFLFGGTLRSTGETGKMTTKGDGASACKDALVSLTIKPL